MPGAFTPAARATIVRAGIEAAGAGQDVLGYTAFDEGSRKVIEVATWSARRGHRALAERENLLWGLLADFSSPAVRMLLGLGVSLSSLWADLQRWNSSAA